MNHLQLAFTIGLLGSLHCVGMCGPLAFAIQDKSKTKWAMIFQKLAYNLGRALTYAFLGLLIGLIGKQLWLAGLQQSISILSGVIIILITLPRLLPLLNIHLPYRNPLQNTINKLIGKAILHKSGHFMIGILNGFLPCGFVYLALATAVSTSSVLQSSLFMFFFGLGTIPLMLTAMLGINFAKPAFRRQINRFLPLFTIFLGCWFILRGLNLDIPYLSPKISNSEVICH
ncbi:MAG: sulfite exporter TauE/SafE family protein [Bacteroidetes bacterium]|nr:sulfite exporter TauE/SafE family protein [Bacteroidota bacterium]MBU1372487.1 sulfite exporter TauE/SafE family protein [Bacteroidota bacterium]MBU1485104.1 sulfite exporter TauE/SafE family protein [Bacteroidota bacterium]MBU1762043.1 sulfite exporter TauE/SafE family protein [Bacteroidota bacterium]MBU2045266.1 sulfite exporter TauE/SafE family protein [Bacteroidota bacterium]